MSQAIGRTPQRRLRWFWTAALLQVGCTNACSPDLTVEQLAPYTDCGIDGDCVIVNSACSTCTFVAVSSAKQKEFEEFRGCWPENTPSDCFASSCTVGKCVHGTCQATSVTNCFSAALTADGGTP